VKLWAAFAEGPRIFMVMDFAAGGSLYLQLLKRKSFSEREAYRILMQVAAAL
jgi:serine/threonine protein kinase